MPSIPLPVSNSIERCDTTIKISNPLSFSRSPIPQWLNNCVAKDLGTVSPMEVTTTTATWQVVVSSRFFNRESIAKTVEVVSTPSGLLTY